VDSDHIASPSSPLLRTKLLVDPDVRDTEVQIHPVRDRVGDHVVADQQAVHRAVQPDPDLGVVQVEVLDRRAAADRAADPVDLVGVDPFAYVALDREVGQVDPGAPAVRGVLAVEPVCAEHRLVGAGSASGRTLPLMIVHQLPARGR
jgi:hypothetical protein